MTLSIVSSIKKMFQKDKSTNDAAEPVQARSSADSAQEVKSANEGAEKKPKHGEEGNCCGNCQ